MFGLELKDVLWSLMFCVFSGVKMDIKRNLEFCFFAYRLSINILNRINNMFFQGFLDFKNQKTKPKMLEKTQTP